MDVKRQVEMERIWENIEQIIQSKYQLKGDEWVQVSVSKGEKFM